MKKRCLSIGLAALSIVSILMLTLSTVQTRVNVSAASPPPKTFAGYIPSAVTSGQARLIGHHPGTDQLALAIGLPLRNQQALTQLLNRVSTPHNPHYRHYLTQAQANQAFNPTPQQEQQVIGWLQSHGLTVTQTYPNHLLVDVTGNFVQIEQAFHVTINDFTMQLEGKQTTFYAPSNEPTVDGSVSNVIDSILGLDDYPRFHVDDSLASARPSGNGIAHGSPPYYPQDFANTYHVNPLWKAGDTGVGQHIGIVLWVPPPSDTTLTQFARKTGANVATLANGRLRVIPVQGGSKYPVVPDGHAEAGMDIEYTSGMAPGATIDYYEAPDTLKGNPTTSGLEAALNRAGTDANNNAQISDSWVYSDSGGTCEAASISDPFTMRVEQILQSNTATGHDYFFSSGDYGSACVPHLNNLCTDEDPYPQYPASSAYVTSVGGTRFNGKINGGYPGEVAWHYTPPSPCPYPPSPPVGSGGGYSKLFAQPSWQAGISKNKYRGYPDVAADADPYTGAYICYDDPNQGSTCTKGIICPPSTFCPFIGNGTSLATPLWAGMIADVNQYVQSQNKLPLGFINPLLYAIHTGMPYTAYHDITKGTNGKYYARLGWDAVTGLGSPDLYNLARDAASLDPSASNNDELYGIAAVSANDVWIVGDYIDANRASQTLTEHWNGSTWNVVPSPNAGEAAGLNSVVAISATDIWAVGLYTNSNGTSQTLTEHWNGSTWNVVPSPNASEYDNYLFSVAAVSANDVWAVGYYIDANGSQTLIEHWNGSTWNVVPSPNPGQDFFNSVAVVSTSDVWAVGNDIHGSQTLIEHWNGSTWNVVPSPNPGENGNSFLGVAVVSANDVWAVGTYGNANGSQTLTEHWNGSTWNVVPSPNPGQDFFNSVAVVSTSDVWAIGSLIEHWNGNSWTVVPSPNASALSKR